MSFQAELDLAAVREQAGNLSRELDALRSGVRAYAEDLIKSGRTSETDAQDMLKQLGVKPLTRASRRVEVHLAGKVIINVMSGDDREAQVLAGAAIDRGVRSMTGVMLPGGARMVELYRDGQPIVLSVEDHGEVTTNEG